MTEPPVITLATWTGPWADDDPDANFKADVAAYAHLDPAAAQAVLAGRVQDPAIFAHRVVGDCDGEDAVSVRALCDAHAVAVEIGL